MFVFKKKITDLMISSKDITADNSLKSCVECLQETETEAENV